MRRAAGYDNEMTATEAFRHHNELIEADRLSSVVLWGPPRQTYSHSASVGRR